MDINIALQNLDDKPRTMSSVDDSDLSAPKLSLNNVVSRRKRRYSSSDEESIKPRSPKRISKGGFVKAEPIPSLSPYSTPACYEATEANVHRESSNSKRKSHIQPHANLSTTEHEPEESEETRCLNADIASGADFDSDVTTKVQSQQAWLVRNYEAVREHYHDLVKLTTSLYAIQNDLETYLQTYGDFDLPDPLHSPGYSQPLQNQVTNSFAEGGSNNPLEIRDEDIDPQVDELPIRNQDLSGSCLGESSTEVQESV